MSLIKVNTIQNANGTTALTIAANGQLSSVNTAVANVTTLNATSGVLATQNGMTGIGKSWVYYNGSTQTIISSFNISSVTRTATGYFTVNFTTAMPNANYVVAGSVSESTGGAASTTWLTRDVNNPRTTTTFYIWTLVSSGTVYNDNPNINLVVFSS